MKRTLHKEMATKPFTGSSRKVSETQTELPRKETETELPQKQTESELPQNRNSEAGNSNQTCNIRENVITAERSRNVGIFDFNNEYHEGGTETELPQNRNSEAGNSNQTCNVRENVIRAEKSRNVGIFDFNNENHEGGGAANLQGRKGKNKTYYNIDGNKIDSKEGEFVGVGKFGNKYYNLRKDKAKGRAKKKKQARSHGISFRKNK